MKYPLIALAIAVSGCATPPPPPSDVRPVGQSQLAPKAAAQCIASKWANSSGQVVYMQYMLANDQAFDVYVPGQQPPSGTAAIVRQGASGSGSSVGFRGTDSNAASAISQCP
ncbi:hypothetical protein ACU4GI_43260 [Cupriavidus basilensis]|jgi:hypothetical protein|uniref:hypothetical protein n=1 Tax=Cupriavidus TaxID=106589 RepID=UPI0004538CDE|nr:MULTISPECIES: hypothetical protein [Cupriavidus]KDP87384.1 hypothetical protein CF70_001940 [Cupriavidus sp. SK-3]MDF3888437.1 hypothetical protein [Cupriavidus basilensis]